MEGQPMDATEAADFLRVSLSTMLKLLRAGEVKAVKVGRQWRITRAALDAFLAGETRQEMEAHAPATQPEPKPARKPRA